MSEQRRHAACSTKAQLSVPLISGYARILRPDKFICTRTHRLGADNLVWAREQSTRDDARYTRRATRATEPFVTVSRQCHVRLATYTLVKRDLRPAPDTRTRGRAAPPPAGARGNFNLPEIFHINDGIE